MGDGDTHMGMVDEVLEARTTRLDEMEAMRGQGAGGGHTYLTRCLAVAAHQQVLLVPRHLDVYEEGLVLFLVYQHILRYGGTYLVHADLHISASASCPSTSHNSHVAYPIWSIKLVRRGVV